jgi:Tfp pilus assembly protein PilX
MMKTNNKCRMHRQNSRGVALITALLLLSLFTVMTLAMVIATSSDTLIDGYYRNARGSFYASDSGLNAARQNLQNQILAAVPAGYTPSTGSPVLTTSPNAMITNLDNTSTGFGANQSILATGSTPSATSWPGKFKVDSTGTNTWLIAPNTPAGALPTCTPAANCGVVGGAGISSNVSYTYPYQITVIGQSRANEQNTVVENGTLTLTFQVNPTSVTHPSFAAYGTLFDQYALCGGPFVAGTMSGQFFSNDSWNFGDAGQVGSTKYIFTGSVGAFNSQVGYIHSTGGGGDCVPSSATSDTNDGTTINPTFGGGLNLNSPKIPLPTDSSSQARAVLDGIGEATRAVAPVCTTPPCAVTDPEMNAFHMTNISGSVWPSAGGVASGVYLPYTLAANPLGTPPCLTGPCFTGGGIYVQGNADKLTLAAATGPGPGNNPLQVFTIKQGSTTTTVTVDLTAQTTKISDTSGAGSVTINGVPDNLTGTTPTEAAMVYVNGSICSDCSSSSTSTTGLSGPSSGAAIQNDSAVTVTATGTISITGSLLYSTEPVTLNTADTLITSPKVPGNVLGIFTPGGDIQLLPSSGGNNMEIDASIAAMSSGGTGGLDALGNSINTLTIVGGRIANKAKVGNLSARNIWFDQRFANGFAPPFFPTATVTTTITNTAVALPVVPFRVSWVNTTAQ